MPMPVTGSLNVTVILVSEVTVPGDGETSTIRGGPAAAITCRTQPRHTAQAATKRTMAFTGRFSLNAFSRRIFQAIRHERRSLRRPQPVKSLSPGGRIGHLNRAARSWTHFLQLYPVARCQV